MFRTAARRATSVVSVHVRSVGAQQQQHTSALGSSLASSSGVPGCARGFASKPKRKATRKVAPPGGAGAGESSGGGKALQPVALAWTEVKDAVSGKSSWWNKTSNETTALGRGVLKCNAPGLILVLCLVVHVHRRPLLRSPPPQPVASYLP